MKAATGELNLTLITVLAVGAIATLFATVIWPAIKDKIVGGIGIDEPVAEPPFESTGYIEYIDVDYI